VALTLLLVAAGAQEPSATDGLAARLKYRECVRAVRAEAVRHCRDALALGLGTRRAAAANELLARALIELERWEEAEAAYREVMRLRPEDPAGPFRVGMALFHGRNRAAEAEPLLRQAVEMKADEASYHIEWAIVLNALERHAESRSAFEKALELDPKCLAHRPAAQAIYEAARRDAVWP